MQNLAMVLVLNTRLGLDLGIGLEKSLDYITEFFRAPCRKNYALDRKNELHLF